MIFRQLFDVSLATGFAKNLSPPPGYEQHPPSATARLRILSQKTPPRLRLRLLRPPPLPLVSLATASQSGPPIPRARLDDLIMVPTGHIRLGLHFLSRLCVTWTATAPVLLISWLPSSRQHMKALLVKLTKFRSFPLLHTHHSTLSRASNQQRG